MMPKYVFLEGMLPVCPEITMFTRMFLLGFNLHVVLSTKLFVDKERERERER